MNKHVFLYHSGAVVAEGGKVVIDKSKLDASNLLKKVKEPGNHTYEVWYRVTSLPNYGVISVGSQNLTNNKTDFSQAIIDQDGIVYIHDDSENHYDYFSFDVWLNQRHKDVQRPQERNEVVSESFSITVTPINDQAPVIKNLASHLKVAYGDTVTLTPENLHVNDQDTLPEDIHYTVTSKPNNGFLFLSNRQNETVLAFTQGDVNSGRVHFVQDGELSPGVFNFSVTDGVHQPLHKLLRVEVEPATITLVNNTGLTLRQGQHTVVCTSKHLAARTNKRNTNISYQVTRQPLYGSVRKDGKQVVQFDQEDLQSAKISYQMTELTSPQDSFEFTVAAGDMNLTAQRVNITVSPLIHMNHHVRIPSGIAVKLRRNVIDASELAALSRSDPVFEIISTPKHGRLVKFGQKSLAVKSFTFQDVIQGRVAIEENANITILEGNVTIHNITKIHHLKDSFQFLLKAKNVQPAQGEFMFTVVPYNPLTGMPVITEDSSQKPFTQSPSLNNTHPGSPLHPRTGREHKERPHKHKHKTKARTRSGGHGNHGKPAISNVDKTTSGKQPVTLQNIPVWVESMPRPASDPLLIILPFLACLFLIVILIVLILVFRHRREKRARHSMIQELSAVRQTSDDQPPPRSPCLGTPERSVAVPSVVVTPVRCPDNPMLDGVHADAIVAGMSPLETPYILCAWTPVTPVEPEIIIEQQSNNPTLGQSQYWV